MPEVAGGKDAGDGSQIFCRDAQDDSPRCGLAPQRKSALRSFRCRWLLKSARAPFAVNIRREFEKCKPRRATALTASGRSPERRRSQAKGAAEDSPEPSTTTLRGRNERTGSSGNVWRNWGYLAGLRQAQKDRWRQPTGRWRSEGNNLAPQVGFEPTTLRLTAECSTIELLRSNGRAVFITSNRASEVNVQNCPTRDEPGEEVCFQYNVSLVREFGSNTR